MPAEARSTMTNGRRTPDSVLAATELARSMLDKAEDYHTATYMHSMLHKTLFMTSMLARFVGVDIPAQPTIHRMPNFPMVPAVSTDRKWVAQEPVMGASAQVVIASIVKNRPALTAANIGEEWRLMAIGTAAARAAAWDAVRWVPHEHVIWLNTAAPATAWVSPNGPGRAICKVLNGSGIQAITSDDEQFMLAIYKTWDKAFVLAHALLALPPDTAESSAIIYGGVLTNLQPAGTIVNQIANQPIVLGTIMQAAMTALPREVWDEMRLALEEEQ